MINKIYVGERSPIHELNFWTKFLCLLLILPMTCFISNIKILGIIAIFFVAFLYVGRLSIKKLAKVTKFYIILLIIALAILTIIFYQGNISNKLINIVVLISRFALVIFLGSLFAMVTSPLDIVTGMIQIKIPHKFGITVMAAFRMLPLITRKVRNIIDAQHARGAALQLNIINFRKSFTQLASLIIPAIHSTLEMTTQMAEVVISRGYNPKKKITYKPVKFGVLDYIIFLVSLTILVISLIYK